MARSHRPQWQGASYHVTTRANDRGRLFIDDLDRKTFLQRFVKVISQRHWTCLAYCLMGNHVHAVLVTPEPDLGHGMRDLLGRYSYGFNRRHSRAGHLLESRYWSGIVRSDSQMVSTIAYVLRNPAKAGLVARPELWPWSNHAVLVGDRPQRAHDPLEHRGALAWFGGDSPEARKDLRRLVAAEPVDDWPLQELVRLLGTNQGTEGVRLAIRAGYSQVQIARCLGTSQSTLSRRLRAAAAA